MSCFLQLKKQLRFLRKTFQDFSPWVSPGSKCLKVQISVSVSKALHNSCQGIRVSSSETIGHFLKTNLTVYTVHFNHTCSSCSSSVMYHALRHHVGKVTHDEGVSTHPVFDLFFCKVQCRMILKLEEMRWSFSPHSWISRRAWPFQCDIVMYGASQSKHL